MTLPDHEGIALTRAIHEVVARAKLHQSCISCTHFDEPSEGCRIANNARPPAKTIAFGCKAYTEDPPF